MRHCRIVMKTSYFLYAAAVLVLFNCTPKAAKTTATKAAYEEDLSTVRPPVDSLTTIARVEKEKAPFESPEHDITPRLNSVIDSIAYDNRKEKEDVYTIQVYVGNNREEANRARSEVYRIIPDETPKMEYSPPNYRVKVGIYLDRLDAHKTLSLLKKTFPGAILLSEKIYLDK